MVATNGRQLNNSHPSITTSDRVQVELDGNATPSNRRQSHVSVNVGGEPRIYRQTRIKRGQALLKRIAHYKHLSYPMGI